MLSYCDACAAAWKDFLLLVGRVMLGWIFAYSGFMKSFKFIPYSTRGWPAEWFWGPVGAGVELVGGVLILLGLGTRYASILLMLFVIVATFSSHRYWEFPAAQVRGQQSQFFKNVAIFGGFVVLFVTAGGRFSLDRWLRRK